MDTADIVVIGAGAAGLMAATRAAERGRRVLLLEKNRRPGVKILMSGGTRCNLTQATSRRGIIDAFGKPGLFLNSALAALGPDELVSLMEAEGVPTKVEPPGKIFPVSNKAADVLRALRQRLDRSGAVLRCELPVRELACTGQGFRVETSAWELTARSVIVTTGGLSYPGSGTTGDGYPWAEQFGHQLVPRRPALVPLATRVEWVRGLMGLTLADVGVAVVEGEQVLSERRGGFLFAHFGLSGPAVLDVSRAVTGHRTPGKLTLRCDFLPGVRETDFAQALQAAAHREGRKLLPNLVNDVLAEQSVEIPRRLVDAVAGLVGVAVDRRGAELSRDERTRLVQAFKAQAIPLTGGLGYEKAEVTAGGVPLDEVDSRTMQSRRQAGLYFAGEILDLDGPIGGYNFQAAFSTGWLAGDRAAG